MKASAAMSEIWFLLRSLRRKRRRLPGLVVREHILLHSMIIYYYPNVKKRLYEWKSRGEDSREDKKKVKMAKLETKCESDLQKV